MSFNDIIGQEGSVNILQEELSRGRINHAYLFSGQEGVGKKTLAYEFARALNCQQEKKDNCGKCISCRKIIHNNHPDVRLIKIEEGNSIKIEQVRELQKDIAYKPYESERKVYIIDDADRMTSEAANSVLKTLEEPPGFAVIILLAEEKDRLLPTVISRCQQINLNNIPEKLIIKELKRRIENNELKTEKKINTSKVLLIARLANGSLGRAFELIEDNNLLERRKELLDFLYQLPGLDRARLFQEADILAEFLNEGFPLFDLILNWYRDIILYNNSNNQQIVNKDYNDYIDKLSSYYSTHDLLKIISLVNEFKGYIDRNVKKDLVLSVLFLKIRSKRFAF